jgi:ABC-type branched-subunit amino acid transport system permease subunit
VAYPGRYETGHGVPECHFLGGGGVARHLELARARLPAPRPDIATGDRQFYYLVLAVTDVIAAVAPVVSISRLGRLLRGMAESESAIAVCGADITPVKVAAFCLSAFVAAIAGALSGMSLGTVTGAPGPGSQSEE